jgi:hypothetical protein
LHVFTQDHHQLGAVGSGGLLHLLATENGAFELTAVRRFTAGWERGASARLRVGDTSAVLDYAEHDRLRAGTTEAMQAEAVVRAYLTDTLPGHRSLLVVGSNSEAAELSTQIRQR